MIEAVKKAMAILEILEKHKLIGVTEIAEIIDVNKSSAYRILATLESKGFVEKDEATKKYMLGTGFLKFSTSVLENMDITRISKPYIEELVRATQESTHLAILSKNKAVFVDQKNGLGILGIMSRIGDVEPLHCSAVGKSLIAFLPEDELNVILDTIDFKAFTMRTITSKQALSVHFEKIRQQGYAVDDEEIYNGVRCVAAPIMNYKGKVIASIGISGPSNRIDLDNIEKYASIVKETAEKISVKLGYKP